MFLRSRSRPSAAPPPAVFAHSDPARSTRLSLPEHSIMPVSDVARVLETVRVKTQCERDECLFIFVSPTRRRSCARWISPSTSLVVVTTCSDRLCTYMPLPFCLPLPTSSTILSSFFASFVAPPPKPPRAVVLPTSSGASSSKSDSSSL